MFGYEDEDSEDVDSALTKLARMTTTEEETRDVSMHQAET